MLLAAIDVQPFSTLTSTWTWTSTSSRLHADAGVDPSSLFRRRSFLQDMKGCMKNENSMARASQIGKNTPRSIYCNILHCEGLRPLFPSNLYFSKASPLSFHLVLRSCCIRRICALMRFWIGGLEGVEVADVRGMNTWIIRSRFRTMA